MKYCQIDIGPERLLGYRLLQTYLEVPLGESAATRILTSICAKALWAIGTITLPKEYKQNLKNNMVSFSLILAMKKT
jgi:hypothetical protein